MDGRTKPHRVACLQLKRARDWKGYNSGSQVVLCVVVWIYFEDDFVLYLERGLGDSFIFIPFMCRIPFSFHFKPSPKKKIKKLLLAKISQCTWMNSFISFLSFVCLSYFWATFCFFGFRAKCFSLISRFSLFSFIQSNILFHLLYHKDRYGDRDRGLRSSLKSGKVELNCCKEFYRKENFF